MVMGVCATSEVNNWTVFDSLDLTSQEQEQEKGLLGRTDRGPTKMKYFAEYCLSFHLAISRNPDAITVGHILKNFCTNILTLVIKY